MTVRTYWWSPARDLRSAATEMVFNREAWLHLIGNSRGGVSNFGDALNSIVLEHVLDRKAEWTRLDDAQVVGIGSVLNTYVSRDSSAMIFGSGVRDPGFFQVGKKPLISHDKVISVRGHLSRDALGLEADTLVGEPGLLINQILPRRVSSPTCQTVGLLPHFSEFGNSKSRDQVRAARRRGIRIIYPNGNPSSIAHAISHLDLLLTSSLHGLVFADAYGIPVQLVTFSSANTESYFKFDDYSSVFGFNASFRQLQPLLSQSPSEVIDSLSTRTAVVAQRLPDVQEEIHKAVRRLQFHFQNGSFP